VSVEVDPQTAARLLAGHDPDFLSRIEDASLNASAPPQQRWMDGWLVRTSPGKAQRARCINAVALGRRPVADKLAECEALYRKLQLPMLVRVTPFTQPAGLDAVLHANAYGYHDDTRVMVLPELRAAALEMPPPPAGVHCAELAPAAFAEAVGLLRGSSPAAKRAHAERLLTSPVPYRGFVLAREGAAVACGQIAQEADVVGLYDIATDPRQQRLGLASWLCKHMLTVAITEQGARCAYLQVGADNEGARRIYARLGFTDGYSYHYRLAPTET
jgi:ribosomal protein S18 acetylase RimI-like enzyme